MTDIIRGNVIAVFLRITGADCGESFRYGELIDRCCCEVGSRLKKEPSDLSDTARCEYAAAALAVYEYTLESMLKDRVMFSENGGAYSGTRSETALRSAEKLKNEALGAIADLMGDEGFLFVNTGRARVCEAGDRGDDGK